MPVSEFGNMAPLDHLREIYGAGYDLKNETRPNSNGFSVAMQDPLILLQVVQWKSEQCRLSIVKGPAKIEYQKGFDKSR